MINSINWGPDRRGGSIIQYPWSEELVSSPKCGDENWHGPLFLLTLRCLATFFVTSDQIGHATRASAPRPIKLPPSQPQGNFYWELLLNTDTSILVLLCILSTQLSLQNAVFAISVDDLTISRYRLSRLLSRFSQANSRILFKCAIIYFGISKSLVFKLRFSKNTLCGSKN
jgi:hypothetical protein